MARALKGVGKVHIQTVLDLALYTSMMVTRPDSCWMNEQSPSRTFRK